MREQSKKRSAHPDCSEARKISRRGVWPFLLGSLMLPLLAKGNAGKLAKPEDKPVDEEEFETLLKSDGTVVKVPKSAVSSSKVVDKHMSNKSLLSWLKAK
ncbi:hypothetical protein [Muriicola sp.]|uniref:hypothetical protein n=1 Tax=Muriicola sp. TaxID=2020856 RepID=UPI0035639891